MELVEIKQVADATIGLEFLLAIECFLWINDFTKIEVNKSSVRKLFWTAKACNCYQY
jgi:hypothetical protein